MGDTLKDIKVRTESPSGADKGREPRVAPQPSVPADDEEATLEERAISALKNVYDPEIPVNIYDLGLIYTLEVNEDDGVVAVEMTLTAPGCPVAQTFPGEVEGRLREVEGIEEVTVTLVWDPPWTQDRMTEGARLQLGLL